MDPGTVLAVVEGERIGEIEAGRGSPSVPDDDGDPAAIGVADTARMKKFK